MKLGNRMLVIAMVAGVPAGLVAFEETFQLQPLQLDLQCAQISVGGCAELYSAGTECEKATHYCPNPACVTSPPESGPILETACYGEGGTPGFGETGEEEYTFSEPEPCWGTFLVFLHWQLGGPIQHLPCTNEEGGYDFPCEGSPTHVAGSC